MQNRLVYDIANDCFGLSLSGIHIDKNLSREEAETLLILTAKFLWSICQSYAPGREVNQ